MHVNHRRETRQDASRRQHRNWKDHSITAMHRLGIRHLRTMERAALAAILQGGDALMPHTRKERSNA